MGGPAGCLAREWWGWLWRGMTGVWCLRLRNPCSIADEMEWLKVGRWKRVMNEVQAPRFAWPTSCCAPPRLPQNLDRSRYDKYSWLLLNWLWRVLEVKGVSGCFFVTDSEQDFIAMSNRNGKVSRILILCRVLRRDGSVSESWNLCRYQQGSGEEVERH